MKKLIIIVMLISLTGILSRGSPVVENTENDFFTTAGIVHMVINTPVAISGVVIDNYIYSFTDTDQLAVIVSGMNLKLVLSDSSESRQFSFFIEKTIQSKSVSGGTDIKKECF